MLFAACCCSAEQPPAKPVHARVKAVAAIDETDYGNVTMAAVVGEYGIEDGEGSPPPGREGRSGAPEWSGGQAPTSFRALITKSSKTQRVGLQLEDVESKDLLICKVLPDADSPVRAYNASVPEELRIREGDYIKEVNGQSDKLREAVHRFERLELLVQRPTLFTCKVPRRAGESLGLDLRYEPRGANLLIAGIGPGAVERSAPEVRAGDRVLSVNGFSGSSLELLKAIAIAVDPELTLSRASA